MGNKPACCCEAKEPPVETVEAVKASGNDQDDSYASTKSIDEAEAAGEAPVKIQLLEVPSRSSLGRGDTYSSVPSTLTSKQSKLLRLQSLGHLDVDSDMLKGLTIRKSLRSLGSSWMTLPQDMSQEQLVKLHAKAVPMESFKYFLSHTWSTPGQWKVLSLTLQTGWICGALFSVCAASLAISLCMYDILPMPWSFTGSTLTEKEVVFPLGCWVSSSSLLGVLLGLFVSPYLPCLNPCPGNCFIDMVSIDQSDDIKMEDGIYGIGGFLSRSTELRVLWSAPYLSRLWCVFELAAYRKTNPEGKIKLTPLYIEQVLLMLFVGMYAVLGTYWVLVVFEVDSLMSGLVYLLCCLPAFIPLHHMRRSFIASKHKLLSDLAAFDIDQVECMNDFDREFIHAAVIKWYGSRERFTEFVRGPLRDEMLKSLSGRTHFPAGYFLLVTLVPLCMSMEYFLSYWKAGMPGDWLLSYAIGSLLGFDILWTLVTLRIILYLCDRLAAKWGRLDFLKTLSAWIIMTVWQSAGAILQSIAIRDSLWTSTAWCGLALFLFVLSWLVPC